MPSAAGAGECSVCVGVDGVRIRNAEHSSGTTLAATQFIMSTKKEKNGLEHVESTNHVLMDVGTVSGAVTGAVVGVLAGPPGIIVGGAIGAALGTVAGAVLDRESHQGELHDRELDDAIGVTDGDLGAREAARASFTKKEEMAEAHRRALEAELDEGCRRES